ncbi:hypothetical protein F5884DRAFT_422022 [Xylogone sp. PMI_703]|nr:hypothetical protein F5884DRAFT_422022 [Xylogone sp. PMI_703]
MAVFAIKATPVTRAVLRRSHFPSRSPNLVKQQRRPVNTVHGRIEEGGAANTPTPVPVHNVVSAVPLWQRLGPLSRGIQAYGRSQRNRPYVTQFCSSLVIYFLGDLSAQSISGGDYDPMRTLRALVISAGSSIPSYKWFIFLNNHFNYASKALSLFTKVAVNQVAFAPIFNTYFFGMQSLLSGDTPAQIWDRLVRTVPISWLNSCKLWPAVTAFSFTFIPHEHRSIFAGVIAIGWQTYLSYLNRKAEVEEGLERATNSITSSPSRSTTSGSGDKQVCL